MTGGAPVAGPRRGRGRLRYRDAVTSHPVDVTDIDPAEADRLVAAGALLLDVREDDEWAAGHAPAAVHLPMGQVVDRIGELPTDRTIVCMCRVGRPVAVGGRAPGRLGLRRAQRRRRDAGLGRARTPGGRRLRRRRPGHLSPRTDPSAVTVYLDDWRQPAQLGPVDDRWSHLVADTDDELHAFAARMGMRREWFQDKPGRPHHAHYDLPERARAEALAHGAVEVTWRSSAGCCGTGGRTPAAVRAARRPTPTVDGDPVERRALDPRTPVLVGVGTASDRRRGRRTDGAGHRRRRWPMPAAGGWPRPSTGWPCPRGAGPTRTRPGWWPTGSGRRRPPPTWSSWGSPSRA